jgi:tetratricopeptide (TPR) repeat protein
MNEDDLDTAELESLRSRWSREPTPQLSLQLAEEYGRRGRAEQAVEVLEGGLEAHPRHLSTRVALARYRFDLGQVHEAVAALEEVVAKDPTHLVANKLLAKAYSELGEPRKARDRLDLYRLLNESDPEIGMLQQMVAASGPLPAEQERALPMAAAPETEPQASPVAPPQAVPVAPPQAVPVEPEPPRTVSVEVPETVPAEAAEAAPQPAPAPEGRPVAEPVLAASSAARSRGREPFPNLWRGLDATAYLSKLLAGLFSGLRGGPITPPAAPREEAAVDLEEEEGEGSLTLADLYLEQGHRGEAMRALRAVLGRQPENREALARLKALARSREGELTAFDLLDGVDFAATVAAGERKARLLRSYLDRISGGHAVDV